LGLPMTAPVAPWSVRGRHIWWDWRPATP